jgi:predicted nucleic acid-binding protein
LTPPDLVVDASVAVKLFVDEELSDEAALLFQRLAATPPARFFVPDLLFLECANILWKYLRFGYDPQQARQDISDLLLLPLQPVAAAELLEMSFHLAIGLDITAYDASYVALARDLEVPLITADRRLSRKLAGAEFDVRWLGEPEFAKEVR